MHRLRNESQVGCFGRVGVGRMRVIQQVARKWRECKRARLQVVVNDSDGDSSSRVLQGCVVFPIGRGSGVNLLARKHRPS